MPVTRTPLHLAVVGYLDHKAEMEYTTSVADLGVFLKANSSVIGPGDDIRLPYTDKRTDQEGELGVVIGRTASHVGADEALGYVFGYTCVLDITVRSGEDRSTRKSSDTFTPPGPWIVTADDIPDPDALDLRCDVGGTTRRPGPRRLPHTPAVPSAGTTSAEDGRNTVARALELHNYVGHLIRRAEQVHTALWYQRVSREITSQQFAVLNALSRDPGIDQRTLARLTSLDRSTVNHIVRRLTDQHHVSQVRDEEDRRRTLLDLTAQGTALLDSLIGPAEAVNERLLDALPGDERQRAVEILRKIATLDSES
ncbi:fumarylacetoacetate hydrolase family protein [Streptomyces ziwulingensis]|uniref:HTH marR-type domain-containing protein n=1 Tax=Streptomyces ziwulingensis TaxID=1045501 RepID=A0ABP9CK76_9ACTN